MIQLVEGLSFDEGLKFKILQQDYTRLNEEYTALRDDYDHFKAKMTDVIAELLLELGEARYKANIENPEGSKSDIMHRINQYKENEDVFY